MINISAEAIENRVESESEDLGYYKDLKPGTKKLKIDYYIGDPYDESEYLGTIDVFESGQMGCSTQLESGFETIHNEYSRICGDNPQPIGILRSHHRIADNNIDPDRMERAKALLELYAVPTKKIDDRSLQSGAKEPHRF